ncbi:putative radical SAM protein YgiQ [Thiorhodovibrio winogradskyi]|uniref:Radical SAM protein YgiQ n=1 Tax=Thiorhodovibrio winogradskyi TaxID=77007 RepID=A0ABZ0S298_9GAMM|nr:YgiQ family radical SAM protein [Thiorhodovibrio winogradskyi]
MTEPPDIFSYRKHWAHKFGTAPELPMSRAEMDLLGWDACDVIIVCGDAYVDHPSFGMSIIGRLLEAQGFRVGIIAQPDWTNAEDFRRLGRPALFFGITAGNMDSMVNRYTAERRKRSDDAYTPDAAPDRRPDRALTVYAQRAREAYKDVPIVLGGIEASLRRVAHYDYWSEKVRRSVLVDAKADILLFGNAERALVALAHRLARGESISAIRDLRGTAFMVRDLPRDWTRLDARTLDQPGRLDPHPDPYRDEPLCSGQNSDQNSDQKGANQADVARSPPAPVAVAAQAAPTRERTLVQLPAYEQVRADPVLYAHAARVFHLETNPGNARALVQAHGNRWLWLNPPPIPLTTPELDRLFELPFARRPHSSYGAARIPAWEMIRFSVNIMRGCFGGCTFCSITEHEGRVIQSRSRESILRELEDIRDRAPEFTGSISDLGGPTANMWRMSCRSPVIAAACRRLSCVHPDICKHLNADHGPLIGLYRQARAVPGIKRILIASGLRYDLAVRSPAYVRELVTHHVGGYLKIAPEHTEPGPLSKMLKPGIGSFERFRELFERYSREAGKEQYLIPYFIAAHPGTSDEDMLNLALWLKRNRFRLDQVQSFLPTPLSLATAMYHSERNPLKIITPDSERVAVPRGQRQRRLHKAFLRYHDPDNWPLLREALTRMGRTDLIGNGKRHLVPSFQPAGTGRVSKASNPLRTQSSAWRRPSERQR